MHYFKVIVCGQSIVDNMSDQVLPPGYVRLSKNHEGGINYIGMYNGYHSNFLV